jgi:hypothetical protein
MSTKLSDLLVSEIGGDGTSQLLGGLNGHITHITEPPLVEGDPSGTDTKAPTTTGTTTSGGFTSGYGGDHEEPRDHNVEPPPKYTPEQPTYE